MFSDFLEALNQKYNCSSREHLSGLDLQHYLFAESTNTRGQDVLSMFEAFGYNLNGLKILDIGCAYGGFCVEAARKGAVSYGVEISESLYRFACLNGKNEQYENGQCKFILVDATSPSFMDKIPNDFFDIILKIIFHTAKLAVNFLNLSVQIPDFVAF